MPPHNTDRGHIRIVGGQDEEVRRARHDLAAPERTYQRDLDRLNGRARHVTASPSMLDRIVGALGNQRFFDAYLGFYAGCLTTVGLAALWARVL